MKRNHYFLKPTNEPVPKEKAALKPKCYSCKKFPVCSIRSDYLKTATLIDNILGNPHKNDELKWYSSKFCKRPIPFFEGFNEVDIDKYFNFEFSAIREDSKTSESGAIKEVKYHDKNFVQFLCDMDNYLVIFTAIWDKDKETYKIELGKEIFYDLEYALTAESIETFQIDLLVWREDMEKKEADTKPIEIINTTFFSAQLNCDFYEVNNNNTKKVGGRPIDEHLHHVATYHMESNAVAEKQPEPEPNKINFVPYPFVYPTNMIPLVPPQRRGDRDEY